MFLLSAKDESQMPGTLFSKQFFVDLPRFKLSQK